jgi:hypothetical protein
MLQSGDGPTARQGLSAFLAAHLKVSAAMNLAAKRAESSARSLPSEAPLEQPTNSAIQLAGEAQRQRDLVCMMLYSALEMNEGLDGLPKAATLLADAKSATLAAAEALNPLILHDASMIVPATFQVSASAPNVADPGAPVPITLSLSNVGDEKAAPLSLRVTRVDADGTTTYALPITSMDPFESAVETLSDTMPATAGNLTLVVTVLINGEPDSSAEIEVRTPEAP